jgi:hypothetical protein
MKMLLFCVVYLAMSAPAGNSNQYFLPPTPNSL